LWRCFTDAEYASIDRSILGSAVLKREELFRNMATSRRKTWIAHENLKAIERIRHVNLISPLYNHPDLVFAKYVAHISDPFIGNDGQAAA
jgi:hypothetical protein